MGSEMDFNIFRNVINGELSSTEKTRHNINPATGQPNPEVPVSTQADVDAAVEAGKAAFKSWSKTSVKEREKALLGFADGLTKHTDALAKLLVQEQGKPLFLAQLEITGGIKMLQATVNLKLEPEVLENTEEKEVTVRYTPLGLAVGIVPWNFPFSIALMKIAPAVWTGNCVIIKPSPFTPYCGLKIVEIAQQFFPPGVVQALSGDDSLGPMLTAHPGPDKISFTGSIMTGKKVMESASKTLKRVTLELGGNDPAIICSDVDVDAVAPEIAMKAFANSGQICIAIKRVYVHESIYDKFRDAMVRATAGMKIGEGNEPGVFLGPIQNAMQFEKVKGFYADIEKEKWNVAVGGKSDLGKPGYFLEPTIIDRPPPDSRIVVEEPFGPIVPLLAWNDEAAVIEAANSTSTGLGASVWSNDLEQARRIGNQIESGTVWINSHQDLSATVPFGGHKESGIGHEFGLGGLKSYCNAQVISVKKQLCLL